MFSLADSNFYYLSFFINTGPGPLLQYLKFVCFLNPLVILNLKANLNKYRINKLQVCPMKTCFRPRRRIQVSMLFFLFTVPINSWWIGLTDKDVEGVFQWIDDLANMTYQSTVNLLIHY